jgi:hypothetical protein
LALDNAEGMLAYEWVEAEVTPTGIQITYQVVGKTKMGDDALEDDTVATWPEEDVRRMVGQMLEIHNDDLARIQLQL